MSLIGLISDTHGLVRPKVLEAFQNCSLILHAGDVGAPQVLVTLGEICPVIAVRGNMDMGKWAQSIPPTEFVQVENLWVYMLHDLATLDISPDGANVGMVLSGHSHNPESYQKKGITYFNPGSAGPKRFQLPVTVAVMEVHGSSFETRWVNVDST